MRKKDFWTLLICNLVTLGLLIEYLSGLEVALTCLLVWIVASMIIHICVLKDYIFTFGFVKEDHTK